MMTEQGLAGKKVNELIELLRDDAPQDRHSLAIILMHFLAALFVDIDKNKSGE